MHKVNHFNSIVVLDFKNALYEFANALGQDPDDEDCNWYISDLFEQIVRIALDKNTPYESMSKLVYVLSNETGESRATVQSAVDLCITQILVKLEEMFPGMKHFEIFKLDKKITRKNKCTYLLEVDCVYFIF